MPVYALQELNYDAAAAEQLEEQRRAELAALRTAKEAVEGLSAQMSGLDFSYRDPERGWDRNRVKGVSADCCLAVGFLKSWLHNWCILEFSAVAAVCVAGTVRLHALRPCMCVHCSPC
jgi:hypothetical protein